VNGDQKSAGRRDQTIDSFVSIQHPLVAYEGKGGHGYSSRSEASILPFGRKQAFSPDDGKTWETNWQNELIHDDNFSNVPFHVIP
jgi:hypothetical protein